MARLIESESEQSSSIKIETPKNIASHEKNKMNSTNNSMNTTACSPRKFSFKTKQHVYSHSHFQSKLVATKLKVNNTSTVAELANKFNTIIVNDGDKNNRHHVILKRKHSVDSSNTRNIKDLPNTVKEAIRIFEQSNQKEQNNDNEIHSKSNVLLKNTSDYVEKDVNEKMTKSSRIIVIRKNETQKMKRISSLNESNKQIMKEQPQNTLKKPEIIAKDTSNGISNLSELRSFVSMQADNSINKIRRPLSMGTDLNQNKWSKTSRHECEIFLTTIKNNLRHTSMINLNNSSQNDPSYHHKISDKYLINKYNTLKPELKPKPEQTFLRDRRKSIADIQFLQENTEQISTNRKDLSQDFFLRGNEVHSKINENNKIEHDLKKATSMNELNKEGNFINRTDKTSNKTSLLNNREIETGNKVGTLCKNANLINASVGVEQRKTVEIDDKVIKNNKLSIPKISSEFENILNHQNEKANQKITESKSLDENISQNTGKNIQHEYLINNHDKCEIIKNVTLSMNKVDVPLQNSDKTDTNQPIVPTKPNNSFLWRSLSKDFKDGNELKKFIKTEDQDGINNPNEKDSEIYSYIEINSDTSNGNVVKNTPSLHQNPTIYQSLPNLNNTDIDDDTYEELNYYSGKFYIPNPPEKMCPSSENIYEAAPMLPEKNSNQRLRNTTNVTSIHPDISKDTPKKLEHTTREYENKNLPDLVRRDDGENHYHEPRFMKESHEEQSFKTHEKRNTLSRGTRQILSNIDDKYAIIVKPIKRDQGESNYNYESILSVKDESHYNSIQDDTYDDVLNVMQMDNCYESIKAESECGSFWEKDNSIYGIKAPSILSNNSSVTTVSSGKLVYLHPLSYYFVSTVIIPL